MPEEPSEIERPRRDGVHPAAGWAWARRLIQLLAFLAILVAPFLGGWQRLDRNRLASWDGLGWDLPDPIMTRLPIGEPSARAYEVNQMLGGGAAIDYLGVPVVDPVGGSLALAWTGTPTLMILVAWMIPIALGLLAGRIFCGWFCPFGTLARGLDIALRHVAPRWPRVELPRRRWLRFVILGAAIVVGALGSQTLLYLLLPHALVQQAGYGLWLMGGGGAALGALVGLLIVGLVFGPTSYCAMVCPTGASLAALGRARVVHLTVVDAQRCGKACDLCDRACWLDLRPSAGAPGPDCDLCARCTMMCPHDNLAVVAGRRPSTIARSIHAAALALIVSAASGCASEEASADWRAAQPRLLLDTVVDGGGVDVFVSVVEVEGFRNDPDDPTPLRGSEIAVYLARGPRGDADEHGKLPARDVYLGPLDLRIHTADGEALAPVHFEQPNYPRSVGRRTIYLTATDVILSPGARVELAPIPEWTRAPAVATIPAPNLDEGLLPLLAWILAGGACFAGLLALSIAAGTAHQVIKEQR